MRGLGLGLGLSGQRRQTGGAPAAAGTAQSNVLAQDRNIVRTSTNNETGSKTIAIGILSDANTATQTFTCTRAEILKGAAI